MSTLTNTDCEAWIDNDWRVVAVESLLSYPKIVRRCIECHGPVRLHKAGPGGKWPAHAENFPRHDGCSLGHTYDGNRRPNPDPVSRPTDAGDINPILPEEILAPSELIEGAAVSVSVNAYERNLKARAACLKHYGLTCFVCDFNFKSSYGDSASHIIHVHHLMPLNSIRKEYVVDPIKDLRPVCPNCHAVIHSKSIPLSIEKVKSMLADRKMGANNSFKPMPLRGTA